MHTIKEGTLNAVNTVDRNFFSNFKDMENNAVSSTFSPHAVQKLKSKLYFLWNRRCQGFEESEEWSLCSKKSGFHMCLGTFVRSFTPGKMVTGIHLERDLGANCTDKGRRMRRAWMSGSSTSCRGRSPQSPQSEAVPSLRHSAKIAEK